MTNWSKSFTHSAIVPLWLAERVWCTKSKCSLLNIFFHLSEFQPSLLLNLLLLQSEFLNNCSHCTPPPPLQKKYPICDNPLSKSARCSIAPLQRSRENYPSYVNRNPIPWYDSASAQKLSSIVWAKPHSLNLDHLQNAMLCHVSTILPVWLSLRYCPVPRYQTPLITFWQG